MSEYGLIIADDGARIGQGRHKYDSRRRTLIVDLEAKPPHMQIVKHSGGTAYSDPVAPFPAIPAYGRVGRDILFEMDHPLGFAPIADVYIYSLSYGGSTTDPKAGAYGNDVFFMSGSGGTLSDVITWEATPTKFRIVHYFDAYGFGTGYTSDAPSYQFRTKFYMYSIDSGRATNSGFPYDGTGTVNQS